MKLGILGATAALAAMAVMADAQVRVNMKVGRPENFNRVDPHKMGLNHADKTFIQNAYFANAFEAKIGALAMNRASDPWVKDFGHDMHREHMMANNELKALAHKESIGLSNNWPRMFVQNYNKLSGLSGSSFDRAFTKMNKQGHMMVMKACANDLRYGHDAGVRGYATKMLAVARSHEKMVMTRSTMMASHGTYGTAAQPIKP